MKKIILTVCTTAAFLLAATTASAQGVKIIKTDGTTIDIPASELDRIEAYDAPAETPAFEGTWKMKKLVTDKAAMEETWMGMATYGDQYPAFNAEDQITFENGKLIPSLQSTFKNFFIGEATYEPVGKYNLRVGVGEAGVIELDVLKVTGVNRYFSATEQSEDKVAYIGVRLVEDEDADEAGTYDLDVYLIDYESHSFAPELLEFGMYMSFDETPYLAAQTGMFINFIMKRAE